MTKQYVWHIIIIIIINDARCINIIYIKNNII